MQSFVLQNYPCEEGNCPDNTFAEGTLRRYYALKSEDTELMQVRDVAGPLTQMLVPFDIDEDGRIDVIAQKFDSSSSSAFSLQVIYNNVIHDSFFIKSMMLSQSSSDVKDYQYGAVTPGASFRYIVTTLDDKKYVRVAAQLPQQSYQSIPLPYVYMGIGRSNNFLESFNVGYSINN
mmetsp:Transcript_13353/g.22703  ORF Transcript_13353/g.22703 Transcript_13353/m.22703 type:complete len:176 (+) Transcript_13353:1464-1991(+)